MIYRMNMFTKAKDLEELTRLTHDELWDKGFNLDDMDIGFEVDKKLHTNAAEDGGEPEWFENENDYSGIGCFLNYMNGHCVGASYTEYGGKHYYTVHHS